MYLDCYSTSSRVESIEFESELYLDWYILKNTGRVVSGLIQTKEYRTSCIWIDTYLRIQGEFYLDWYILKITGRVVSGLSISSRVDSIEFESKLYLNWYTLKNTEQVDLDWYILKNTERVVSGLIQTKVYWGLGIYYKYIWLHFCTFQNDWFSEKSFYFRQYRIPI